MAALTERDLIVACLHPKIADMARSNMIHLKTKYTQNETISKVVTAVDRLLEGSKNDPGFFNCTQIQFEAEVLKLQMGDQINQALTESFMKFENYTSAEITAIQETLKELVVSEVISIAKRDHTNSPTEFVKSLQDFNLDGITAVDERNYRESSFSEISITDLAKDIEGVALKSSLNMINNCSPLGGYLHRTLTMVSGKPGGGKSLFMIQEACNFILQGKKVLYLALGDMNEFHFITRIASQLLRKSLSEVNIQFEYYYKLLLEKYPQLANLKIQYFLPDSITCSDWIALLKTKGYIDEYDVFIADYDTNFSSEEEMYQKGETTYNQLKALSDRPGKYVFVACQPKPSYYSEEILPLESGNESSRKQQIVDNMITISNPPSPGNVNHIGIINLAKHRGGMLSSVPILLDKNGRFEEISLEMYNYLKVTRDSLTLPGSGCGGLQLNQEVAAAGAPSGKR